MEIYKSEDGKVTKYIHTDGSETAIKTVSSCNNIIDSSTNSIITEEVDKEKFSVFMSSSVGCPLKCSFCHLTINNYPYVKLTEAQLLSNFKEALLHKISEEPALRKRYIKLSCMGMGDAFLRDPYDVRMTSLRMLRHAVGDMGIQGIDGVDISTILPPCKGWQHQLGSLDDDLRRFKMNPNNPKGRSRARLFYSLISAIDRKSLIPAGNDIAVDLKALNAFNLWYNIDVITHNLILKDFDNVSAFEINHTVGMLNRFLPSAEFRILRYNKNDKSSFMESKDFVKVASEYNKRLKKVKIQTSQGEDVKASCGMFICKHN